MGFFPSQRDLRSRHGSQASEILRRVPVLRGLDLRDCIWCCIGSDVVVGDGCIEVYMDRVRSDGIAARDIVHDLCNLLMLIT